MRTRALATVLIAGLALSGCYFGVRAGPTLQRANDRDFERVGWTIGAFTGIEATFFDKLRIALGFDGAGAVQRTSAGKLTSRFNSSGVKLDATVWQVRTWTREIEGCPQQRGGWRIRAGLGLRAGGGREDAVELDGTTYGSDKFRAYDATVEAGGWRHTSNFFAGLGFSYARLHLIDASDVRSYAAYVQIVFGTTGPFKTLNTLFSNYGAIEAEREERAWRSVDCSNASDRIACERKRSEQVDAWSAKQSSERDRAVRQRAVNKCL